MSGPTTPSPTPPPPWRDVLALAVGSAVAATTCVLLAAALEFVTVYLLS